MHKNTKNMMITDWLLGELISQKVIRFEVLEADQFKYGSILTRLEREAKERETQNMIEMYCQGCLDITNDDSIFPRETAEQRVNELFEQH